MKLNVEHTDTVAEIKEKLQETMGTKNQILLYSMKKRFMIEERLDNDVRAVKLEDEKLCAYEYIPEENKKEC